MSWNDSLFWYAQEQGGTYFGMKLHAALHACTTMNENQVQQTRQHDKI